MFSVKVLLGGFLLAMLPCLCSVAVGADVPENKQTVESVRQPVPLAISIGVFEQSISEYCEFESTGPIRAEFDIYPTKEERRYECTNEPQFVVSFNDKVYQFDVRFNWRTGSIQGYDLAELVKTGGSDGYAAAKRSPTKAFNDYISKTSKSVSNALEKDPTEHIDTTFMDVAFVFWLEGDFIHILTLPAQNLKLIKERRSHTISSRGGAGFALGRMEDRTKELYDAAYANNLAAVRLILDENDQNVNVAYDENDTTPLMLACRHGNEEMARLLISKGANIAAVDAGGMPVMEYLRKDSRTTFNKLRALILKTAIEKKIILPFNWDEISVPDCDNFTAAASYPSILPVENLTDGNPRTAWAGKTGDDIWLFVNGKTSSISVVNGYNKTPALFKANNRVKSLAVSVWAAAHFAGSVSEVSQMFNVARLTPDHVLTLKDLGAEQSFPLPFNWEDIRRSNAEALAALVKRGDFKDRELIYSYFVVRVEPLTVYRGTKYDDTCISELKAGGPWLHEARLHGDWVAVSGSDAQILTFSGSGKDRAFLSYLNEKPLLSGTWHMENGKLLIETGGGTRRYTPALEEKGAERLLKLTGADGKLEIYKYKSR
jgi:hypothetical protein